MSVEDAKSPCPPISARLQVRFFVKLDKGYKQGKNQRTNQQSYKAEHLQTAKDADQYQNWMNCGAAAHQTGPQDVVDVDHERGSIYQKADATCCSSFHNQAYGCGYPNDRCSEKRNKSHQSHDRAPEQPVGYAENQQTDGP